LTISSRRLEIASPPLAARNDTSGKVGPGGEAPWRGVVGDVPFRPNPLTPFPAREGGKFGGGPGERLTPKSRQTLSPRGWENWGWRGRSPIPGGLWDVLPNFQRRGEQLTLTTPPRVGPKTSANPQPTRVGKRGVQGAKPPWRGVVGGVPPQNLKRGRVANPGNPATNGTQNVGEP
jgi:hypothetical protein